MGIYRGPGGSGDATTDSSTQAAASIAAADAALASQNAAHVSEVNAAASAASASTSANTATTQASSASSSASAASTSAASAATSSATALSSKNAAATSETNAANSATASATSATNSASSATSASGSASTATTKASEAATSASSAATSANSASTSASTATSQASLATTKASDANTSANNAATSATASETSATNSATSATNSSNSASTATTQAGIATTKASEAYTSAANAANSATNAANSATAASTSETNASNSATSASASATAAAASYDSFDDRYLGSKTSDPTLDNDGNALLVGALYFNSSSNVMKVYNGTLWQTAYVSLSGALISSNNLSDLNNATTSRTNLGLGSIATQNSNAVSVTGGSISGLSSFATTGNATIGGNLTVNGTTTTVNTQTISVQDNMIYMNEGSTVANPDLGVAGNYNDGTYRHTGFFRDATDGRWKLFHQYTPEPDVSPYIDTSHASFALADMQANMFYGNLTGNVTGNVTGTVTNGVVTTGSYSNPSWLTALDFSKVLPSVSGNANKYLSNNGTALVWNTLSLTPAGVSDQANTSTGYFSLPVGTTVQRPVSPANGYTRLNTTIGGIESYYNGVWDVITWFKTPAAPTIGTATSTGSTIATVTFTAPTDVGGVGSIISSYTAVASPGGASGTVNQSGSGTITITGLTTNTAYTFTVYATNQAGNSSASSASNSVTTWALPGTPTIGTATPIGTTSATISYTAPASNGGTAITSYTAVASPGGATGTISQAGSGTITVNGLSQNTSYTFTVYATNAVGNGSASSASNSALTWNVPNAPTVGTATATSSSTATVAFTAPAYNGGTVITSYTAISSPGGKTGTISQAGSGIITVTGLTFNTAYTFTVYATNSIGNSASSTSSNSITTPVPAPVTNALTVGPVYSSWNTTNYAYGSYTGPAPVKSFNWSNTVSNIYWSNSGFQYSSDNASWVTGFDSPQPGNGGYSNAVYTGTVTGLNHTTLYIRVSAGQPDRSQSSANSVMTVTQANFT